MTRGDVPEKVGRNRNAAIDPGGAEMSVVAGNADGYSNRSRLDRERLGQPVTGEVAQTTVAIEVEQRRRLAHHGRRRSGIQLTSAQITRVGRDLARSMTENTAKVIAVFSVMD